LLLIKQNCVLELLTYLTLAPLLAFALFVK
jgi:hypothetical protein